MENNKECKSQLVDRMLELKDKMVAKRQQELDRMQALFSLYEKAVAPNENGIAAMSEHQAKRFILGMSEQEIMDDLLEQFRNYKK